MSNFRAVLLAATALTLISGAAAAQTAGKAADAMAAR